MIRNLGSLSCINLHGYDDYKLDSAFVKYVAVGTLNLITSMMFVNVVLQTGMPVAVCLQYKKNIASTFIF